MAKLGKPVAEVKLTTSDPDDFRPSFGGAAAAPVLNDTENDGNQLDKVGNR